MDALASAAGVDVSLDGSLDGSTDELDGDEKDEDDGCYEVDPTLWAERVDESYQVSSVSSPAPTTPVHAPPTSAIEEPASAEANPMARSRAEASERAATDAFEGSSSHPREREKVETVEGRVMTKKMLRELAARRGLSYTDMLAQARASGVDLPDE